MMAVSTILSGSKASWSLQTLLRDIRQYGDQPALLSVGGDSLRACSFAELADEGLRLAAGLLRDGLEPGEPVLVMGPNCPDWVIVSLGLGAAGALIVPQDYQSTPEEVAKVIHDCGCRRAFVAGELVDMLHKMDAGADLQIHVLEEDAGKKSTPSWRQLLGDAAEILPAIEAEAPTILVYTSGTTGVPKSFALTSRNIDANVRPLVEERLVGPGDRLLLPLPLHHVYPFVVGLLVSLSCGASVVFPEGLAGPQIVQALRVSGSTGIVGVPRLYAALAAGVEAKTATHGKFAKFGYGCLLGLSIWLRRRVGWHAGRILFKPLHSRLAPSLRILVSGGAALGEGLIWRLEGLGWEVRNGYGLAETTSIFTGNLPERERIGSEGRPFQGGEIRISNMDESGVGEIQLRGPNVFAGYRNNPEANREAFTTDGWFRTGDLGCLDAEGYLHFKGRAKELIVLGGGKNVFPEELERAYGASPFIHEVAVLEQAGALHALVRPDTEAIMASGTPRIEDTLRVALGSAGEHLPSHQRLSGYALVRDPLPRTRLGKYRRFLLPDLYEAARRGAPAPGSAKLTPEDRSLLTQPLAAEVWRLLGSRYPRRPLSLEASLQLDLGIDSLEWVALSLELERRLGVQLSETEVAEVFSVRDLIGLLKSAASRSPSSDSQAAPAEGLTGEPMRWTQRRGLAHALLAGVIFALNWLLMRWLFRLKTAGLAKLPPSGGIVIVANHASDLDPLVVAAALSPGHLRRVFWGGDSARLFTGPFRRFLCRVLQIFPVDERAPGATLKQASKVLKQGQVLIWFPESWRSPTGELQPFLPGIGQLIEKTGVTAVAARISGTYEAMPRWARFPRFRPIAVRFGEPLTATELAAGNEGTAAARITAALETAVAGLAQGD